MKSLKMLLVIRSGSLQVPVRALSSSLDPSHRQVGTVHEAQAHREVHESECICQWTLVNGGQIECRNHCLLLTCIISRLVVPALKTSLLQSIPAQPSCTLALENLGMNSLEVPPLVGLSHEGSGDALYEWVVLARHQVDQLFWVLVKIEELGRVRRANDKLPWASSNHHDGSNRALASVFAVDCVDARMPFHLWHEGVPIHWKTNIHTTTNEINQGRNKIHCRYVLRDGTRFELFWVGDHEWDSCRSFEP